MSLLLDALNRASKEKQKAAAAASQAQAPATASSAAPAQVASQPAPLVAPPSAPAVPVVQPLPEAASFSMATTPVAPLQWEELPRPTPAAEHANGTDVPRVAPPVLTTPVQSGFELELTLVDAPPAVVPASMARFEPPPSPTLQPSPETAPLEPAAAELVPEPRLETRSAPVLDVAVAVQPEALPAANFAPPPAPEPASTPREPTLEAPVAPAQVAAAAPPPTVSPPPPTLVGASTPPPTAPAAPVPPVEPPLGSAFAPAPKSLPVGQMAQDIRRAYDGPASDARTGRRRVMALGGLAVGLALAFGSVFLGLWGDPAKWVGGSSLSTVAPPTRVAIEEPAAPAAPAEAAGPAAVPTAESSAAVASASAVTPAPATVVLSAPAAAVPTATPKTASPPAVPVVRSAPSQAQASGEAAPKLTLATAPASADAAPAVSPKAAPNVSPASTGNEVVLGAHTRANPNFVPKTRGPSPLEHGYALLLEGRLDDAAAAYSQALRANADERDALLGMAYISQQKGQRDDAQSYYRRVLRQEPNNARALAALQALDSGSDATLNASRTGDLAARQPDSAAAMAMAGNAYVRDGLLSNAAQAYARAQALEPANPLHAYNHAVALDRLGRYAPAAVQYERVLALSATAPVAVRAYQIEDVRLRLAQLRQALAASTESTAP